MPGPEPVLVCVRGVRGEVRDDRDPDTDTGGGLTRGVPFRVYPEPPVYDLTRDMGSKTRQGPASSHHIVSNTR